MKPYHHARISAKKYGGKPEDYQHLHDFFDQTKSAVADVRHRSVLHNAFGIFLLEQLHGPTFVNSEGKTVNTRDIGEDHVMDDLGFIPTLEHWCKNMAIQPWMGGKRKRQTTHRTGEQYID